MKEKTLDFLCMVVLFFDIFVCGFYAATGNWFNLIGLAIMAVLMVLILYKSKQIRGDLEKLMEKTINVLHILPIAEKIIDDIKNELETIEKENTAKKRKTDCSAANNDQIEYGHIADNDKQ